MAGRVGSKINRWRARPVLRPRAGSGDVENATLRYLMYVLLPAWFVPGVLDWWMHRRTRIGKSAGVRESLIHALMMPEVGFPVLRALLLEINPPVLALMLAAAGV